MKKSLIILGLILLVILSALFYLRTVYTKSFSPEATLNFEDAGLKIQVFYNRPYKKGRVIFGDSALVRYGKVWRTGANEPTTFEANKDLIFDGKTLPAGKYSLWTIPGPQTWTVIFNTDIPSWGVDFNNQANRDPKYDLIKLDVPVVQPDKEFEQFTISVEKMSEEMELILFWDKTLVAVPFGVK
jgi:hypothetical protein